MYKITLQNGEVYYIKAGNIYQLIAICDRRFQQDYTICPLIKDEEKELK
jgi:hypothetical protein